MSPRPGGTPGLWGPIQMQAFPAGAKSFETEVWRVTAVGPRHVFNSLGASKTVREESEDTCWSGVAPALVPAS